MTDSACAVPGERRRRGAARWFRCVVAASVVLGLAGCASAPDIRYYRVVVPLPSPAADSPIPATLGVARLLAPEPCRQERILYRASPYRVEYYAADRWEVPPADMVQEALFASLRSSGRFRRVVAWRRGEADYRLETRLQRFEEVDEADGWYGVVDLEYEVVDGEGRSLTRGVSQQRVRAETHSVEGVVAALSRALAVGLDEITRGTATALRAAAR